MHRTLKKLFTHSNLFQKFIWNILLVFFALMLPFSLLHAEDKMGSKADKKNLQRWTLQEWLAQKERNKLMDQWLQMHTPTPYEFFIELQQHDYSVKSSGSNDDYKTLSGAFAAYATLVGLEFQNTNNAEEGLIDNTLLFHMRLLGAADQSSHFTLSLGQKTRRYNNNTLLPLRTQTLGQLDLTLYFNSHFGLSYYLKSFYPITNNPTWGDLTGSEQKALLFIDFEALRVFGGVYTENEVQTLNTVTTKKSIQGSLVGIRLYF